jgi:hypothetical protein
MLMVSSFVPAPLNDLYAFGSVNLGLCPTPLIQAPRFASAVRLHCETPNRLVNHLSKGVFSAALLPPEVIGQLESAVLLPSGGLDATAAGLEWCLCSDRPFKTVRHIDDRLDNPLARLLVEVLWLDEYGRCPAFTANDASADARLCSSRPDDAPYCLALADLWGESTALPLTLLAWTVARPQEDLGGLERLLQTETPARPRTTLREEHLDGLLELFERAARLGLIDRVPRLCLFQSDLSA